MSNIPNSTLIRDSSVAAHIASLLSSTFTLTFSTCIYLRISCIYSHTYMTPAPHINMTPVVLQQPRQRSYRWMPPWCRCRATHTATHVVPAPGWPTMITWPWPTHTFICIYICVYTYVYVFIFIDIYLYVYVSLIYVCIHIYVSVE